MDRMLITAKALSFNLDMEEKGAKPMNYYVESPGNIRSKFDTVSYQKAGCVLLMFQEAVTVSTFTKGLNYYLNDMHMEAATPDDLHRNLKKAYDEDFPGNDFDLAEFMETWEDQAGYPLIKVVKNGNKFVLTQERFGGGDEIYSIPISFTTKSEMNFITKTPKIWMKAKQVEVENLDEWMILNIQSTSYYKVDYDESIWSAILRSDLSLFPLIHRGQFFMDITNSMRNDSVDVTSGLKLLSFLEGERDGFVWIQSRDLESFFSEKLFGTSVLSNYQKLLHSITKPNLDRLGLEAVDGELAKESELRLWLMKLSCKAFNEDCLKIEMKKLEKLIESGESNSLDSLCEGLRLADETLHSAVLKKSSEDLTWSFKYFYLGCSLNRNILKNYLELAIDTTNDISIYEKQQILENVADKSVLALEVFLEFFNENFDAVKTL